MTARMARETHTTGWAERQVSMTLHARVINLAESDKKLNQFGITRRQWAALRFRMQSAKARCDINTGHANYAGRGIEFRFNSATEAVKWIISHIGIPAPDESIDRIENDGHYEPGNLRWADRATQNGNKRNYRRTPQGERIRALQLAGSDYTYESLRAFISDGLSDHDILTKRKHKHAKPCI